MEIGVYTFTELSPDPDSGRIISPQERVRDLMEEIELADHVGLDVFGVGEHHRPDFVLSSPAVILGAAAEKILFQHQLFGHQRFTLKKALQMVDEEEGTTVWSSFRFGPSSLGISTHSPTTPGGRLTSRARLRRH
jgi:hypothetical protein